MKSIRPVSDLRNNFADISKTVHESGQPVFLTKNGYGDMVVLSINDSAVVFVLGNVDADVEHE